MAYSLVARVLKGGAGATSAIDTTGANLIVISVAAFAATPAPSDSKGNTWTLMDQIRSGSSDLAMYYCQGGTVGSGHTFTVATAFPAFAVLAFSGAVASPLDQKSEATGVTPGSITPTEDAELVVTAAGGLGTSDPSSLTGGFTLHADQHIAGDNATYVGVGQAYLIQTTAAAANPTWTVTTSTSPVSLMASFKDSPGGGGGAGKPHIYYAMQRALH